MYTCCGVGWFKHFSTMSITQQWRNHSLHLKISCALCANIRVADKTVTCNKRECSCYEYEYIMFSTCMIIYMFYVHVHAVRCKVAINTVLCHSKWSDVCVILEPIKRIKRYWLYNETMDKHIPTKAGEHRNGWWGLRYIHVYIRVRPKWAHG